MKNRNGKIRVLVVDDSAVMRLVLRRMIEESGFEVVATAADGMEAIEQARHTDPDVITLDVEMPGLDGIKALEHLKRESKAGILMVSSLTQAGAEVTLTALEKGAFDYIPKTNGLDDKFARELARKIRLANAFAARQRTRAEKTPTAIATESVKNIRIPPVQFRRDPTREVVVIGASTGGPRVLTHILSSLPGDFPLGVLVVQHMPPTFTRALAERLNRDSKLQVREATNGDEVRPGVVLVAPGGKQMTVRRVGEGTIPIVSIRNPEPTHEIFAPSVDVTMLSVAEVYQGPCLAVVLTGMGHDGQQGMKAIKDRGGITLVQDRDSCTVSGMVRSCLTAGAADAEVAPFLLPEVIQQIVGGTSWA